MEGLTWATQYGMDMYCKMHALLRNDDNVTGSDEEQYIWGEGGWCNIQITTQKMRLGIISVFVLQYLHIFQAE